MRVLAVVAAIPVAAIAAALLFIGFLCPVMAAQLTYIAGGMLLALGAGALIGSGVAS